MAEIALRSEKNNRTVLKDVIPLDTPYLMGIFLGDICNFRCKYCIQSETFEREVCVEATINFRVGLSYDHSVLFVDFFVAVLIDHEQVANAYCMAILVDSFPLVAVGFGSDASTSECINGV